MIRQATKDTTVNVPDAAVDAGSNELFLPKDTVVCVDMVGIRELHMKICLLSC